MSSSIVSSLLLRWEEAHQRGEELSPTELCPERPDLHAELNQCIAILQRMAELAADPPAPPTIGMDAGLPPSAPTKALADYISTGPATIAPESAGQSPASLAPPETVRYRVVRPLARGGLGKVFVAEDRELHREVALKEIQNQFADDPGCRARFMLEAEVTGRLEHPGVVPVYGLGCYADGRPYYAMRLIHGQSLRKAIAEHHDSPRDANRGLGLRQLLRRFLDVCNAVGYAHARGVLHRDLKPDNVMLGEFGETLVVDWGLAKLVGSEETAEERPTIATASGTAETEMGAVVGTPAYMSPEQARGDKVGCGSDVYSLGAILYEVLTGKPPFTDRDYVEVLVKVQHGEFPRPRQTDTTIPAALEAVCLKAMAVRAEDRYPSSRELAADVERWIADEPVSACRETASERLIRWVRRNRNWVMSIGWALGLVLAVLGVAVVLLSSAWANEKKSRQEAEQSRQRAEEAFQTAREAVDTSFTRISETTLLNQPGMQPLRKSLLEDGLKYYRRFLAERGEDPSLKKACADAHFREGRILELIGPPAEAIPSYEKALALQRELTEDLETLAALGDTLNALGRVSHKLYRLDDALAFYEEAAGVRQRLVQQKADDVSLGRALANVWMNVGLIHQDKGEVEKAKQFLTKAQTLREELRAKDDSTSLVRETAMGNYNLGVVQSRRDLVAASRSFQAALAGFETIVATDRNDLNSRFQLSLCCRILGDLNAATGKPKDAQAMYARAGKILEELSARSPDVVEYRLSFAGLWMNSAGHHFRNKRLDDAATEFGKAARMLEELLGIHKELSRAVRDLAVCRRYLGRIRQTLGKTEEARALLRLSHAALEDLTRKHPQNADFAAQLAETTAALEELP